MEIQLSYLALNRLDGQVVNPQSGLAVFHRGVLLLNPRLNHRCVQVENQVVILRWFQVVYRRGNLQVSRRISLLGSLLLYQRKLLRRLLAVNHPQRLPPVQVVHRLLNLPCFLLWLRRTFWNLLQCAILRLQSLIPIRNLRLVGSVLPLTSLIYQFARGNMLLVREGSSVI